MNDGCEQAGLGLRQAHAQYPGNKALKYTNIKKENFQNLDMKAYNQECSSRIGAGSLAFKKEKNINFWPTTVPNSSLLAIPFRLIMEAEWSNSQSQ